MPEFRLSMKTVFGKKAIALVLVLAGVLISGCGANYGRMVRSQEITAQFESVQIQPYYRYYYVGGQHNARAILGLHIDYTLKTSSWTPLEPLTVDTLKRSLNGMTNYLGKLPEFYGWVILDPAGKKVGIWYSRYDQPTVKFGDNKEIFVSQPQWNDADGDRTPFKIQ